MEPDVAQFLADGRPCCTSHNGWCTWERLPHSPDFSPVPPACWKSQKPCCAARSTSRTSVVLDYDVAGVLAQLLHDAQAVLQAEAVGLLIRTEGAGLEVLTASSHRAAELELYHGPRRPGSCLDTSDVSVNTFAVQWHEAPTGALNVMYHADAPTPFSTPGATS